MNATCPECRSVFRVDPAKVPVTGVHARCSVCGAVIPIAAPGMTDDVATESSTTSSAPVDVRSVPLEASAEAAHVALETPPEVQVPAQRSRPVNPFLNNTPELRARRLARALVSDLVAYNPQKREQGLREGTLRQLFREEIRKSWEEYVDQVGASVAESTPHFQDALNDVLAGGRRVF